MNFHLQCRAQAAAAVQEAMPHSLTPSASSSADLSSVLALDNIRQTLIRQEDTIIFLLIERAQFARNAAVYEAEAVPVPDFDSAGQRYSLLEYLLRETEQVHGKIRRYTSPDEQAFYPDHVPPLVLPPIEYAEVTVHIDLHSRSTSHVVYHLFVIYAFPHAMPFWTNSHLLS